MAACSAGNRTDEIASRRRWWWPLLAIIVSISGVTGPRRDWRYGDGIGEAVTITTRLCKHYSSIYWRRPIFPVWWHRYIVMWKWAERVIIQWHRWLLTPVVLLVTNVGVMMWAPIVMTVVAPDIENMLCSDDDNEIGRKGRKATIPIEPLIVWPAKAVEA